MENRGGGNIGPVFWMAVNPLLTEALQHFLFAGFGTGTVMTMSGLNPFLMQPLIFQIGSLGWGLSDFWWGLYWLPLSWWEMMGGGDWFRWVWFKRAPQSSESSWRGWVWLCCYEIGKIVLDTVPLIFMKAKAEMLKGSVEPSSLPQNGWYWAWEEFSLGSRRIELGDTGVLGGVGTMSLH